MCSVDLDQIHTGGKKMADRKKRIRLSFALIAAVLIGLGTVAALTRGIQYVIAADIHPTITEPLESTKALPKTINRSGEQQAPSNQAGSHSTGAILGECTTRFGSEPKARNENISLAANSIKGKIIEPGEVFSYNDAVGPTTKENGYKRARIFVRGKKALGYGGGVCQVSSTLYNAAESAGMQIVERLYGMLEIHSDEQAEVRQAGAAILKDLEISEDQRIKPKVFSSQVIRNIDDHQTMLINRMRHGNMITPGQSLYVMEVAPAGYAALAANEAEKAANINILEVITFGSFGRIYLGGEERDIDVAYRAAEAAIEAVTGRVEGDGKKA